MNHQFLSPSLLFSSALTLIVYKNSQGFFCFCSPWTSSSPRATVNESNCPLTWITGKAASPTTCNRWGGCPQIHTRLVATTQSGCLFLNLASFIWENGLPMGNNYLPLTPQGWWEQMARVVEKQHSALMSSATITAIMSPHHGDWKPKRGKINSWAPHPDVVTTTQMAYSSFT